jgi:hypothetical protein
LEKMGLGFIGVVKTATKRFPTAYLSAIELHNRGDFRGVYTKDANRDATAMVFVWMDRDRRYFIATRSSLDLGQHYARTRWRQVDQTRNADPERVELEIPQPLAAEVYNLMLETRLETKHWSVRVNLSLFGMCVIDAYYVAKGCRVFTETPDQFFEGLAKELVDNTYGSRMGTRQRRVTSPTRIITTAAHLTPTKRKRKDKNGQPLQLLLQGRCKVCQKKTSYICSLCNDEQGPDVRSEPWLCHHRNGSRDCFEEHCGNVH